MPRPRTALLVQTLVTVVLGGIGAAAGFTHTHDWAAAHGQHGWLAWADAVVIEGLAIVAGFEIRRDHAAGRSPRLPLLVLVVAFLVQMTAQVAQAEPTPAGWLVAAMPALGFLTVVKLTLRRTPTDNRDVQESTPTPTHPDPAGVAAAPRPAAGGVAAPVARPAGAVLGKLPASLRDTITTLAADAHGQGRQVTGEDIRARASLPDRMLADLVTELNTSVNGHPVSTTTK